MLFLLNVACAAAQLYSNTTIAAVGAQVDVKVSSGVCYGLPTVNGVTVSIIGNVPCVHGTPVSVATVPVIANLNTQYTQVFTEAIQYACQETGYTQYHTGTVTVPVHSTYTLTHVETDICVHQGQVIVRIQQWIPGYIDITEQIIVTTYPNGVIVTTTMQIPSSLTISTTSTDVRAVTVTNIPPITSRFANSTTLSISRSTLSSTTILTSTVTSGTSTGILTTTVATPVSTSSSTITITPTTSSTSITSPPSTSASSSSSSSSTVPSQSSSSTITSSTSLTINTSSSTLTTSSSTPSSSVPSSTTSTTSSTTSTATPSIRAIYRILLANLLDSGNVRTYLTPALNGNGLFYQYAAATGQNPAPANALLVSKIYSAGSTTQYSLQIVPGIGSVSLNQPYLAFITNPANQVSTNPANPASTNDLSNAFSGGTGNQANLGTANAAYSGQAGLSPAQNSYSDATGNQALHYETAVFSDGATNAPVTITWTNDGTSQQSTVQPNLVAQSLTTGADPTNSARVYLQGGFSDGTNIFIVLEQVI